MPGELDVGKRQYLALEHGDDTIGAMRAVKQTLDPKGTPLATYYVRIGNK